jgi:hypothetical protein
LRRDDELPLILVTYHDEQIALEKVRNSTMYSKDVQGSGRGEAKQYPDYPRVILFVQ